MLKGHQLNNVLVISTIKKGKVCRICWRKQVLTIYTRAYMPRLNCWNLYLGFPFTVCRSNNENSLCIITQQEDYRESEKARLREKVDAFLQKKFLSHRWGQCFYYVLLFIQNIFWFLIPWLILHNQPSAFTKFGGLFVKMTPVVQNIVQKRTTLGTRLRAVAQLRWRQWRKLSHFFRRRNGRTSAKI